MFNAGRQFWCQLCAHILSRICLPSIFDQTCDMRTNKFEKKSFKSLAKIRRMTIHRMAIRRFTFHQMTIHRMTIHRMAILRMKFCRINLDERPLPSQAILFQVTFQANTFWIFFGLSSLLSFDHCLCSIHFLFDRKRLFCCH